MCVFNHKSVFMYTGIYIHTYIHIYILQLQKKTDESISLLGDNSITKNNESMSVGGTGLFTKSPFNLESSPIPHKVTNQAVLYII